MAKVYTYVWLGWIYDVWIQRTMKVFHGTCCSTIQAGKHIVSRAAIRHHKMIVIFY